MAASMNSAISSLLCAEDNNIIFCNDNNDDVGKWYVKNNQSSQENHSFLGEETFVAVMLLQSEDCVNLMIEKENQHMPCGDYLDKLRNGKLDIEIREQILDWIGKVHSHFNFGPLCLYLSVNYLDRFLSAYDLPKGKVWMIQLLAIACLSLAAKMEETIVPLSLDLQTKEARFVFEARTIQRMELLILSTLKWRMHAITPFTFIDYFIKKINGDQIASRSLITKAVKVILRTLKGIHFLEFKHSEIAAAVAISVVVKTETVCLEKAISALVQQVQKDRVNKCIELIQESSLLSDFDKGSTPFVPQSPIGVLDATCLSYKTDDSGVESFTNSTPNSPDTKRRKMNRTYAVDIKEWINE
ncbi:PREDICTED: cyclin-D2-1-like [Nicotiana attenuata]|uniref:Cyclin-d2-1 n=1 Tax=Nicotiana attenuata TaxID=49451 RepID=A0A314KHF3_NICAT|nr:PREDICTED: cyclin-D2-1-like [Nicotiana attenuata]OIT28667.1 cyclin-d2-1 [Nicotiana attenuata]